MKEVEKRYNNNNHSKSSLDCDFEHTEDINEAISLLINCENLLDNFSLLYIKMLKCIVCKAFRFICMVATKCKIRRIHDSLNFLCRLPTSSFMTIKGIKLSDKRTHIYAQTNKQRC